MRRIDAILEAISERPNPANWQEFVAQMAEIAGYSPSTDFFGYEAANGARIGHVELAEMLRGREPASVIIQRIDAQ